MDNIFILTLVTIVGVIVVFGIPIYGIMKFYDWLKRYADSQIVSILVRAKGISAPINKNDIMLYSIYGFLNVTIEYRPVVYLNSENINEMENLAIKLRLLSFKLSIYKFRIHGLLLIWLNYRSLFNKLNSLKV